jgi:osmotically-inducible protein OsmY
MHRTPWLRLAVLGGLALAASGCVPVMVGGAAVGAATVAGDPRTVGTQVDDQGIEIKVYDLINRDPALTRPPAEQPNLVDPTATPLPPLSRVVATSYNGVVLLTGEVPSETARTALAERVRAVEKVRQVQDELTVGPPASADDQGRDTALATRVRTRMLLERGFDSDAVKVVASQGTVYLMGLVSQQQASTATELARTTSGTRRVVRLFEILP